MNDLGKRIELLFENKHLEQERLAKELAEYLKDLGDVGAHNEVLKKKTGKREFLPNHIVETIDFNFLHLCEVIYPEG